MKSARYCLFVLAFVSALSSSARKDSVKIRDNGYIFLRYENDYFNAKDWYYTQGIRLELAAGFIQKSPVTRLLLGQQAETFRRDAFFIQHDGYTPLSISSDTVLTGDHPFGCKFYVGQKRISINSNTNTRLTSGIEKRCCSPSFVMFY